jgi:hypothetical protein
VVVDVVVVSGIRVVSVVEVVEGMLDVTVWQR